MKAARWLFVGLATVVAIVLSLGFAIVVGLWFMYGWRVDNGWVLLAICSCVTFALSLTYVLILRLLVRGRWRFSFRTLLVALSTLALICAIVGQRLHVFWRKKLAIDAVEQRGGYVFHFPPIRQNWLRKYIPIRNGPFEQANSVRIDDAAAVDALLEHQYAFEQLSQLFVETATDGALERIAELDSLPMLRRLNVFSPKVTDEGLKYIGTWRSLHRLGLNGCSLVTDEGIRHLEGLRQLQVLFVLSERGGRLKIGDVGLESIGRLGQLEVLQIGHCGATDEGLKHLANLDQLIWLRFVNVNITDEGLHHLTELRKLENLYFEKTKVTPAGISELQRSLPNCTIHHTP